MDEESAYMIVWIRLEDIVHFAFFLALLTEYWETLIIFHLYLAMGYVYRALYF